MDQKRLHRMSQPGVYQIVVLGRIAPTFSVQLEGMQITESQCEDGAAKTTLVGLLRDQAALSGILNTLYELHVSVISVTCLDNRG